MAKPYLYRAIAVLVATTFLVSDLTLPAYAQETIGAPSLETIPADLSSIDVPVDLGTVEDSFQGNTGKVVVLIQDAHSIPDAQRSVRELINHFQSRYGVSLVAVEGAASRLDAQLFKSFPDQQLLKEVISEYHAEGEIAAGTEAALFNETAAVYHGIEDWDLYEEGLAHYLRTTELQAQITASLETRREVLEAEKEKVYSEELLGIDRILQGFYANDSDLLELVQALAHYLKPDSDTEVALLLANSERDPDGAVSLEDEVEDMAWRIKTELAALDAAGDLKALNRKSQTFFTSEINAEQMALFLDEMSAKHGLSFKASPVMRRLMQRHRRLRDLSGSRFFEELNRYIGDVKESVFRTDAERGLDGEFENLRLLFKLSKLEVSFDEWQKLGANDAVPQELKSLFESHRAFYENSESRDDAFLGNLTKLMKHHDAAVLVAGGFHTDGLTQRFRRHNISYLLLAPRIPSIPEKSRYQEQMQGEVSWKDYFRAEDGRINLYEAFARATRDRLLERTTAGSRAETLKLWRDEIIRDLAARGEVERAGEHTRLLDEVNEAQAAGNEWQEKWMANINGFFKGLERLQINGEMNQANVLKLLQPANMIAARTGPAQLSLGNPGLAIFAAPLTAIDRSELRNEDGMPEPMQRVLADAAGKINRTAAIDDEVLKKYSRSREGMRMSIFRQALADLVTAGYFEGTEFPFLLSGLVNNTQKEFQFFSKRIRDSASLREVMTRLWQIHRKYSRFVDDVNERILAQAPIGEDGKVLGLVMQVIEEQNDEQTNPLYSRPDGFIILNLAALIDSARDVYGNESVAHEAGHGMAHLIDNVPSNLPEHLELAANWAAAQFAGVEAMAAYANQVLDAHIRSSGADRVYPYFATPILVFAEEAGIRLEREDVARKNADKSRIEAYRQYYRSLAWKASRSGSERSELRAGTSFWKSKRLWVSAVSAGLLAFALWRSIPPGEAPQLEAPQAEPRQEQVVAEDPPVSVAPAVEPAPQEATKEEPVVELPAPVAVVPAEEAPAPGELTDDEKRVIEIARRHGIEITPEEYREMIQILKASQSRDIDYRVSHEAALPAAQHLIPGAAQIFGEGEGLSLTGDEALSAEDWVAKAIVPWMMIYGVDYHEDSWQQREFMDSLRYAQPITQKALTDMVNAGQITKDDELPDLWRGLGFLNVLDDDEWVVLDNEWSKVPRVKFKSYMGFLMMTALLEYQHRVVEQWGYPELFPRGPEHWYLPQNFYSELVFSLNNENFDLMKARIFERRISEQFTRIYFMNMHRDIWHDLYVPAEIRLRGQLREAYPHLALRMAGDPESQWRVNSLSDKEVSRSIFFQVLSERSFWPEGATTIREVIESDIFQRTIDRLLTLRSEGLIADYYAPGNPPEMRQILANLQAGRYAVLVESGLTGKIRDMDRIEADYILGIDFANTLPLDAIRLRATAERNNSITEPDDYDVRQRLLRDLAVETAFGLDFGAHYTGAREMAENEFDMEALRALYDQRTDIEPELEMFWGRDLNRNGRHDSGVINGSNGARRRLEIPMKYWELILILSSVPEGEDLNLRPDIQRHVRELFSAMTHHPMWEQEFNFDDERTGSVQVGAVIGTTTNLLIDGWEDPAARLQALATIFRDPATHPVVDSVGDPVMVDGQAVERTQRETIIRYGVRMHHMWLNEARPSEAQMQEIIASFETDPLAIRKYGPEVIAMAEHFAKSTTDWETTQRDQERVTVRLESGVQARSELRSMEEIYARTLEEYAAGIYKLEDRIFELRADEGVVDSGISDLINLHMGPDVFRDPLKLLILDHALWRLAEPGAIRPEVIMQAITMNDSPADQLKRALLIDVLGRFMGLNPKYDGFFKGVPDMMPENEPAMAAARRAIERQGGEKLIGEPPSRKDDEDFMKAIAAQHVPILPRATLENALLPVTGPEILGFIFINGNGQDKEVELEGVKISTKSLQMSNPRTEHMFQVLRRSVADSSKNGVPESFEKSAQVQAIFARPTTEGAEATRSYLLGFRDKDNVILFTQPDDFHVSRDQLSEILEQKIEDGPISLIAPVNFENGAEYSLTYLVSEARQDGARVQGGVGWVAPLAAWKSEGTFPAYGDLKALKTRLKEYPWSTDIGAVIIVDDEIQIVKRQFHRLSLFPVPSEPSQEDGWKRTRIAVLNRLRRWDERRQVRFYNLYRVPFKYNVGDLEHEPGTALVLVPEWKSPKDGVLRKKTPPKPAPNDLKPKDEDPEVVAVGTRGETYSSAWGDGDASTPWKQKKRSELRVPDDFDELDPWRDEPEGPRYEPRDKGAGLWLALGVPFVFLGTLAASRLGFEQRFGWSVGIAAAISLLYWAFVSLIFENEAQGRRPLYDGIRITDDHMALEEVTELPRMEFYLSVIQSQRPVGVVIASELQMREIRTDHVLGIWIDGTLVYEPGLDGELNLVTSTAPDLDRERIAMDWAARHRPANTQVSITYQRPPIQSSRQRSELRLTRRSFFPAAAAGAAAFYATVTGASAQEAKSRNPLLQDPDLREIYTNTYKSLVELRAPNGMPYNQTPRAIKPLEGWFKSADVGFMWMADIIAAINHKDHPIVGHSSPEAVKERIRKSIKQYRQLVRDHGLKIKHPKTNAEINSGIIPEVIENKQGELYTLKQEIPGQDEIAQADREKGYVYAAYDMMILTERLMRLAEIFKVGANIVPELEDGEIARIAAELVAGTNYGAFLDGNDNFHSQVFVPQDGTRKGQHIRSKWKIDNKHTEAKMMLPLIRMGMIAQPGQDLGNRIAEGNRIWEKMFFRWEPRRVGDETLYILEGDGERSAFTEYFGNLFYDEAEDSPHTEGLSHGNYYRIAEHAGRARGHEVFTTAPGIGADRKYHQMGLNAFTSIVVVGPALALTTGSQAAINNFKKLFALGKQWGSYVAGWGFADAVDPTTGVAVDPKRLLMNQALILESLNYPILRELEKRMPWYQDVARMRRQLDHDNPLPEREPVFRVNVPSRYYPRYERARGFPRASVNRLSRVVISRVQDEIDAPFNSTNKEHVLALMKYFHMTVANVFSPAVEATDDGLLNYWAGLKKSPAELVEHFFWWWQVRELANHYGVKLAEIGDIGYWNTRAIEAQSLKFAIDEFKQKGTRNRSELRQVVAAEEPEFIEFGDADSLVADIIFKREEPVPGEETQVINLFILSDSQMQIGKEGIVGAKSKDGTVTLKYRVQYRSQPRGAWDTGGEIGLVFSTTDGTLSGIDPLDFHEHKRGFEGVSDALELWLKSQFDQKLNRDNAALFPRQVETVALVAEEKPADPLAGTISLALENIARSDFNGVAEALSKVPAVAAQAREGNGDTNAAINHAYEVILNAIDQFRMTHDVSRLIEIAFDIESNVPYKTINFESVKQLRLKIDGRARWLAESDADDLAEYVRFLIALDTRDKEGPRKQPLQISARPALIAAERYVAQRIPGAAQPLADYVEQLIEQRVHRGPYRNALLFDLIGIYFGMAGKYPYVGQEALGEAALIKGLSLIKDNGLSEEARPRANQAFNAYFRTIIQHKLKIRDQAGAVNVALRAAVLQKAHSDLISERQVENAQRLVEQRPEQPRHEPREQRPEPPAQARPEEPREKAAAKSTAQTAPQVATRIKKRLERAIAQGKIDSRAELEKLLKAESETAKRDHSVDFDLGDKDLVKLHRFTEKVIKGKNGLVELIQAQRARFKSAEPAAEAEKTDGNKKRKERKSKRPSKARDETAVASAAESSSKASGAWEKHITALKNALRDERADLVRQALLMLVPKWRKRKYKFGNREHQSLMEQAVAKYGNPEDKEPEDPRIKRSELRVGDPRELLANLLQHQLGTVIGAMTEAVGNLTDDAGEPDKNLEAVLRLTAILDQFMAAFGPEKRGSFFRATHPQGPFLATPHTIAFGEEYARLSQADPEGKILTADEVAELDRSANFSLIHDSFVPLLPPLEKFVEKLRLKLSTTPAGIDPEDIIQLQRAVKNLQLSAEALIADLDTAAAAGSEIAVAREPILIGVDGDPRQLIADLLKHSLNSKLGTVTMQVDLLAEDVEFPDSPRKDATRLETMQGALAEAARFLKAFFPGAGIPIFQADYQGAPIIVTAETDSYTTEYAELAARGDEQRILSPGRVAQLARVAEFTYIFGRLMPSVLEVETYFEILLIRLETAGELSASEVQAVVLEAQELQGIMQEVVRRLRQQGAEAVPVEGDVMDESQADRSELRAVDYQGKDPKELAANLLDYQVEKYIHEMREKGDRYDASDLEAEDYLKQLFENANQALVFLSAFDSTGRGPFFMTTHEDQPFLVTPKTAGFEAEGRRVAYSVGEEKKRLLTAGEMADLDRQVGFDSVRIEIDKPFTELTTYIRQLRDKFSGTRTLAPEDRQEIEARLEHIKTALQKVTGKLRSAERSELRSAAAGIALLLRPRELGQRLAAVALQPEEIAALSRRYAESIGVAALAEVVYESARSLSAVVRNQDPADDDLAVRQRNQETILTVVADIARELYAETVAEQNTLISEIHYGAPLAIAIDEDGAVIGFPVKVPAGTLARSLGRFSESLLQKVHYVTYYQVPDILRQVGVATKRVAPGGRIKGEVSLIGDAAVSSPSVWQMTVADDVRAEDIDPFTAELLLDMMVLVGALVHYGPKGEQIRTAADPVKELLELYPGLKPILNQRDIAYQEINGKPSIAFAVQALQDKLADKAFAVSA
ncbi:MAG: hypothetical protein Q8R76_07135 [Candidatus Omnitrophota bacterium]|nr:hypothetical protein [Candidatus Omnitrophota bacterium]